jgi:hypothetical protein
MMNRTTTLRFAYLTTDEVNQDLALQMAEHCNATLHVLSPQDAPADGRFDAVLYDWDYLSRDQRSRVLAELRSGPLPCPVALHSYHLEAATANALRRRGVIICRRLELKVFRALRRAVRQVQALAPPDGGPEQHRASEEHLFPRSEPGRGGPFLSPAK